MRQIGNAEFDNFQWQTLDKRSQYLHKQWTKVTQIMTHVNAIYHRLASTCHSQFVTKYAIPSFSSLTNTEGPQFYKE